MRCGTVHVAVAQEELRGTAGVRPEEAAADCPEVRSQDAARDREEVVVASAEALVADSGETWADGDFES